MSLCFYVLAAFLPSLPGTGRHADPKVNLLPDLTWHPAVLCHLGGIPEGGR